MGLLQHFLRNAAPLERIGQFARCVLIELHLIPAQSLAENYRRRTTKFCRRRRQASRREAEMPDFS